MEFVVILKSLFMKRVAMVAFRGLLNSEVFDALQSTVQFAKYLEIGLHMLKHVHNLCNKN